MAKLQWTIAIYSPQQINVFRLSVEVHRTDFLTGGMGWGGGGGGAG